MKTTINSSYIFYFLAIMIVIVNIFVYLDFLETKNKIIKTYTQESTNYVKYFSNNIIASTKKYIPKDIYKVLSSNLAMREELEEHLKLFITKKYKYIYLLYKDPTQKDTYRFLLDGSEEEEKSEFLEPYVPLEIEKFNKVCHTKKALFFTHHNLKSLWRTYLTPIVIDDKVEAILVVDFSIQGYKNILGYLEIYNQNFLKILLFFMGVFLTIIWFTIMDKRREKEKKEAFIKLIETTKELKIESKKVKHLNETLEKRVEDEVEKNRKKDQQLLQQSRLAQMGEMISMIAHQWRQPLSAISSTSIALELKAKKGRLNQENIIRSSQNISRYSQHLSNTINDFRNFFKEEKESKLVSYEELLTSIFSIINISLESKNIVLKNTILTQRKFDTYPNELKQVILNLIKNSEDALIEKDIVSKNIEIYVYSEGEYEVLEVKDNAGGIDENIMQKIFNPYFSTKLEKNGTGLGLYMSKTIIEEHCKGKLTVRNDEYGATFKITLKI